MKITLKYIDIEGRQDTLVFRSLIQLALFCQRNGGLEIIDVEQRMGKPIFVTEEEL